MHNISMPLSCSHQISNADLNTRSATNNEPNPTGVKIILLRPMLMLLQVKLFVKKGEI